MSALAFGFPTRQNLTCANPLCREYATKVAQTPGGDVFACDAHIVTLIKGKRIISIDALRIPGEKND